jgi:hypothetical protein
MADRIRSRSGQPISDVSLATGALKARDGARTWRAATIVNPDTQTRLAACAVLCSGICRSVYFELDGQNDRSGAAAQKHSVHRYADGWAVNETSAALSAVRAMPYNEAFQQTGARDARTGC